MKTSTLALTFSPFQLDPTNACLWHGTKRIVLPPKDFAILLYLVTNAGQLVTHDALLQAVWPDTVVSAKGLKTFVRRLRQTLGDHAATPRFIETVHGRGYRFLPAVTTQPVRSLEQFEVQSPEQVGLRTSNSELRYARLVGREPELSQIHRWLDKAAHGERQLVFVTGEPGIGKTSLVEAFTHSLESEDQKGGESQQSKVKVQKSKVEISAPAPSSQPLAPRLWVAQGQCIEHYGTGEPYLPVLEALGRLASPPEGEQLKVVLELYAPTWLAQLPALLSSAERETLQRQVQGVTRDRMLREIAEALEALTAERTLVLVLEDLHWADISTLELLALLARRQEAARLLILGTYRSTEVLDNDHPLSSVMHELYAHGLCKELPLQLLSQENVTTYLQERFLHSMFPIRLGEVLHHRTDGNPLFVVGAIDDLLKQGRIVQTDEGWTFHGAIDQLMTEVPDSIRHLVARQRKQLLQEERQLLKAASVAGMEFSVAAVAAALEAEVITIGDYCARLAERQQFLRPAGIAEWPDGTVAARYGFIHALYQHVWHERVSIEQQQQWHLRIGRRKEVAYGSRVSEVAAELAVYFEQGRDYPSAIRYLQQAGENALRRSANMEAIAHLSKGLALLQTLPDTPERVRQELGLRVVLTAPLIATKGLGSAELGNSHNRAHALCQQIGETPELFPVLGGLYAFYISRAELPTAQALAEQLLRLAQRAQDPTLLPQAHTMLGILRFFRGEVVLAREHLEQAMLQSSQDHRSPIFHYGADLQVFCHSYAAQVMWFLGYPEQALHRSKVALSQAHALAHPLTLAFVLSITAYLHKNRREEHLTQAYAQEAMTLATEHGFAEMLA